MIRIAYVVDHLQMGGAQRHLLQVARGLDRQRYAPEIWTTSAEPGTLAPDFEALGVPVSSFGKGSTLMSPRTLTACQRVARDWRERDVHIVHGYLFEGNLLGTLAARLAGRRVILVSKRSLDRYDRWDRRLAAAWTNRAATRVTVNAGPIRDLVIDHEWCPGSRIEHIPNGVPLPNPSELAREVPQPPDPRGTGPLVGMVGRLGWKKGYEFALQAFARVREQYPDLRVDIVGDGDLRDELPRQAHALGLSETVRFLGQQTDVPRRMLGFDCYVLSSVIEGMPNALLEAMALGRPVVTTAAGGSAEVVVDGESGLVVPIRDADALAEAIARVLSEDLLAQRLGRAAAERARDHFSETAMLSSLDRLYRTEMSRAGLKEEAVPVENLSGEPAREGALPR